ncbi:MAG: AMP-binding protein [Hyphomonadaceae bacterium]|nr:AMP-binding protein [Hyphomonadaceae bacterium]
MLIDDALSHHERYRGGKPAMLMGDQVWTYAQLGEMRRRLAGVLLAAGVRPGDRVALLSENTPWFLGALFATVRIGAIFVPLNYRLSGEELSDIVRDASVKVLIAQGRHLKRMQAPRDCTVIALDDVAGVPHIDALLAKATDRPPEVLVSGGDAAMLQYTSGTTAESKGVVSIQSAWVQSCLLQPPLKRFTESTVFLGILPMCYTGGTKSALEVIFAGATIVIVQRFDEEEALDSVERYGVTNAFVVPTMLYRLLDAQAAKPRKLSTLKYINSGGAPLNEARLRQTVALLGCEFTQSYGMTEIAGGSITFAGPEDHFVNGEVSPKLRSVGRPFIDCQIKLVDDDGVEIAQGEPGEVWVKTARALKGYWGKPSSETPISADGYYQTGDIARADEDGYLYIVDRKKDMIISGGLNIYSKEVEAAIERHEAVDAAYVVGAPDPEWGESVLAFVVLHAGKSTTATEIQDWCAAKVGRYKRPRTVVFLTKADIPINWGGKVVKRTLRDNYLEKLRASGAA